MIVIERKHRLVDRARPIHTVAVGDRLWRQSSVQSTMSHLFLISIEQVEPKSGDSQIIGWTIANVHRYLSIKSNRIRSTNVPHKHTVGVLIDKWQVIEHRWLHFNGNAEAMEAETWSTTLMRWNCSILNYLFETISHTSLIYRCCSIWCRPLDLTNDANMTTSLPTAFQRVRLPVEIRSFAKLIFSSSSTYFVFHCFAKRSLINWHIRYVFSSFI